MLKTNHLEIAISHEKTKINCINYSTTIVSYYIKSTDYRVQPAPVNSVQGPQISFQHGAWTQKHNSYVDHDFASIHNL